jgi:hypothetical protein
MVITIYDQNPKLRYWEPPTLTTKPANGLGSNIFKGFWVLLRGGHKLPRIENQTKITQNRTEILSFQEPKYRGKTETEPNLPKVPKLPEI